MTREEAEIYAKTMTYEDALYNLLQARAIPYRKATFIKVNELIKALSQECVEPTQKHVGNALDMRCEDAISREAVNTLVDELARAISDERCHIPQRGRDTGHIMHDILELQSVTQKSGKWIPIPYVLDYETDAECSLCHKQFIDAMNYNNCPNCGAKMRGAE